MATSRERFMQTCDFQAADPPLFRWGAFVWPETEAVWRTQGYAGPELGWAGTGLTERLGLDEILRVDPWYGPSPDFSYEVVEEDERTRLYINHEGILMRELKERADTSMPQFVRFPVGTPADFEKLAAERLGLNLEARFPPLWKQQVAAGRLHGVAGAANVTAGGQVRSRWELRDTDGVGSDSHTATRTRADLRAFLDGGVSAFMQWQDVRIWGEEGNTLGDFHGDSIDLHRG